MIPETKPESHQSVQPHFSESTWRNFVTRFRAVTRQLVKDNEHLITEHVEWLGKMRELSEEKEMIKKLARMQAEELKDAWDEGIEWKRKYEEAETARKLLAEGVTPQPGDIIAISLVGSGAKVKEKDTYSVAHFRLNAEGTKVVSRTVGPDCPRQFALDNLKIAVMQEFDPRKEELN